jgi:hypothetical protein
VTEILLMEGELGELLTRVAEITDPPEGLYLIYVVNDDLPLTEDCWSAIILFLDEDDDAFVPDEARERNMLSIVSVSIAQRVVRVALEDKPDASKADLVAALDYYTDNDAFINLS